MASNNKSTFLEKLLYFCTLVGLLVGINYMYFNYWSPSQTAEKPHIKVECIGDSVILRYAPGQESYFLEGVEDGQFVYADGVFAFSDPSYTVEERGEPYRIVNTSGECVGTVNLVPADEVEHNRIELDAATYSAGLLKVPATCTSLRVYTSVPNGENPLSIQVEEREQPLEIILDSVKLKAPDLCPVLYSMSTAPINLKIQGDVYLWGGKNPYTAADISGMDRLLDTLDTAANAYCVVMVSAVGGAASIYKGADYYAEMFTGITGLQLATMENAWGKVESLFNGEDGAAGLDGIPAIQLAGDLNIIRTEKSWLFVHGGDGGRGGDGVGGFINTTRGGRGGKGGSALVCDRLFNGLGYGLTLTAGGAGDGGQGGKNIMGEQGSTGSSGGSCEEAVIISHTEIHLYQEQ